LWFDYKPHKKEILLKRYDDPRIIFAVSCAAVSCPDRIPESFTAARLDNQLDQMIRVFMMNPRKGMYLDKASNTLSLSWILKKDSHLFPGERGGTLGFITPYLADDVQLWLRDNRVKIDYFDHDWDLNDIALADRI